MRPQHKNPRTIAQDILSRREHAEAEIRRKMAKKKVSSADIDDTILWLKGKKYLDDARFAATYIETITNLKPVGPRWLQAKLREKGVPADIVTQALTNHYPPEKAQAKKAADRWRRTHPVKAQDKEKLTRHLISRGFSPHLIHDLLT